MPVNELSQTFGKISMGVGTFLPKEAIFKRRFRWLMWFETFNKGDGEPIPPCCVTIAARPSVTIDETELAFLNERAYIAAKPTWEPIAVTFLDFTKPGGGGADKLIQDWIQRCYHYDQPDLSGEMGDGAEYYKRTAGLAMFNGIGECMERWTLYSCWIQASNWGDLDMSATENATIECTIRFDNAKCSLLSVGGGVAQAAGGQVVSSLN